MLFAAKLLSSLLFNRRLTPFDPSQESAQDSDLSTILLGKVWKGLTQEHEHALVKLWTMLSMACWRPQPGLLSRNQRLLSRPMASAVVQWVTSLIPWYPDFVVFPKRTTHTSSLSPQYLHRSQQISCRCDPHCRSPRI